MFTDFREEEGRERKREMDVERNTSWLPLTHAPTGTQMRKPSVEWNEAPTGAEEYFLSNGLYLCFLQSSHR